ADYVNLGSEEVYKKLNTSEHGLTAAEATKRLATHGHNEILSNKILWTDILKRQFQSSFVYLLIGACILSFFLKEYFDGSMILLFISINTFLGFYQEYKSEKTL